MSPLLRFALTAEAHEDTYARCKPEPELKSVAVGCNQALRALLLYQLEGVYLCGGQPDQLLAVTFPQELEPDLRRPNNVRHTVLVAAEPKRRHSVPGGSGVQSICTAPTILVFQLLKVLQINAADEVCGSSGPHNATNAGEGVLALTESAQS
jgi:hypothetical protein